MHTQKACLAFILLLVGGCASTKPKLDPTLRPAITQSLSEIWQKSTECSNPVVPKVKLSKHFKYGCFCGANHPDLKPSNDPLSILDSKSNLVSQYYRIKSFDSIDSACRYHDVCWLIHGDGDGKCNDELYARLYYISDTMLRSMSFFDTDSREWRCAVLASDMANAFLTLFVDSNYKDAGMHAGTVIGKTVALPLVAIIPLLRLPIWVGLNIRGQPYPKEGERCDLPASVSQIP